MKTLKHKLLVLKEDGWLQIGCGEGSDQLAHFDNMKAAMDIVKVYNNEVNKLNKK